MDSIDILSKQVTELHCELTDHTEAELMRDTETNARITSLEAKVDTLIASTTSLLNLWEQARGMLTLVKWLAAIGSFLASMWLFFKGK